MLRELEFPQHAGGGRLTTNNLVQGGPGYTIAVSDTAVAQLNKTAANAIE